MILRTGTRKNFKIWFLPTSGISSCSFSLGKIISVNWLLCYRFFLTGSLGLSHMTHSHVRLKYGFKLVWKKFHRLDFKRKNFPINIIFHITIGYKWPGTLLDTFLELFFTKTLQRNKNIFFHRTDNLYGFVLINYYYQLGIIFSPFPLMYFLAQRQIWICAGLQISITPF